MSTNDELTHHGVIGQKWGVRRYRNKDGTLTSAGKKRLSKLESKRETYLEKSDKYRNKARQSGIKYVTEIGRGLTESRNAKAVKYDRKANRVNKKINKLVSNESLSDYIARTNAYKQSGYNYTLKYMSEYSNK